MEAFLHANNNLDVLPSKIREYVEEKIKLCQPSNFHVCNGSDEENQQLLDAMELSGVIRRLRKYKNCYIATTDPRDVARVESRTVICTKNMNDIISTPKSGFAPITDPNLPKNLKATQLGNWMDTDEMLEILEKRFAGCMCGRTLYIIPYMMGPYSSPYSKIAVELTDSPYVVASMRIMTRMGANVFNEIKTSDGSDVVKCLHSIDMVHENTIFTNVAETSNGDVYWEGIGEVIDGLHETSIRSWKNKRWSADLGEPAAHPNSRFCTTIKQCSILDPEWNNPQGVPIEAIIFGGRRPEGVPLVYEAFDWQHGVFVGACMRSEATAAAEFKGKQIMHDPFAMRPFFGYNFGSYLAHWLSFGAKTGVHLPKIYHVNWFLRDSKTNEFLWPGFGENIRVIDWIFRRLTQQASGCKTPIGIIPDQNVSNGILGNRINPALLDISKEFWINECKAIRNYLEENVNEDLPDEICSELKNLEKRLSTL
ncbi:unnamed protein product [Rotaria socialis]|uniref:Phosphoenolpyruvate carboxykinase, cytosolic [GTP] n=1 Tax=Rotaria socialis TaxID=392032 RepID=A0A820X698_9BILA|nr:unnamed protein product [Rotaria socialis]